MNKCNQCGWVGEAPCPIHNQYIGAEMNGLSKFTVVLNRPNEQSTVEYVHIEVDDCSFKSIIEAAYKRASDVFLSGDEDYWRAKSTIYFVFPGHHQSIIK